MQIGEVCLLTDDVVCLADFYKKLLHIENGSDDKVHQFLISEGTTLTVYKDEEPRIHENHHICLAFTVDDVDEEYERLLAMGIRIIEKPETQPWGARNMHFCDPDGNHLYFRSFPKGAGEA